MNILLGTFQECESLSSCVQETALFHKILFPPSHLAFQVIPLPHSSCDSSSLHTRSMSTSFIWQHLVIKWIINSSLGQRTKLPLTAFCMVLRGLLLLVCWTWWIKLTVSAFLNVYTKWDSISFPKTSTYISFHQIPFTFCLDKYYTFPRPSPSWKK